MVSTEAFKQARILSSVGRGYLVVMRPSADGDYPFEVLVDDFTGDWVEREAFETEGAANQQFIVFVSVYKARARKIELIGMGSDDLVAYALSDLTDAPRYVAEIARRLTVFDQVVDFLKTSDAQVQLPRALLEMVEEDVVVRQGY